MGIIKAGKVVILLAGRYAGRKAIVVKAYDTGSADRKFAHALVAGISKCPKKVTRAMSKKKVAKRSRCQAFLKYVNVTHLMPTRYTADIDLKTIVDEAGLPKKETKKETTLAVRKVFDDRYLNQGQTKSEKKATGNKYFFAKLRF